MVGMCPKYTRPAAAGRVHIVRDGNELRRIVPHRVESCFIGWNAVSGAVRGIVVSGLMPAGGGAFMLLSGGETRPVSGGGRPISLSPCLVQAPVNEAATARAMSIRMAKSLARVPIGSKSPA
jgi:hypothetical protein